MLEVSLYLASCFKILSEIPCQISNKANFNQLPMLMQVIRKLKLFYKQIGLTAIIFDKSGSDFREKLCFRMKTVV